MVRSGGKFHVAGGTVGVGSRVKKPLFSSPCYLLRVRHSTENLLSETRYLTPSTHKMMFAAHLESRAAEENGKTCALTMMDVKLASIQQQK